MHSKISRFSFFLSFAFLLLLSISVSVFADNEHISYNIYVVGEDRSNSGNMLAAAGHVVTWQSDALQIKLANLSVYDQVWFVDIFAVPDATGRANLINFIKSGGKLFFIGDSYKADRAPLYAWRDNLFNELGAGGVQQSIDVNPSQTTYYTNPFHVTSYSPNHVHHIEHGEGRNGSFANIGNGEVVVGAGLDATGDAIAITFDYGSMAEAENSRAIVYLNSNNTTNWNFYVENLAKFLGPKDKAVLFVKTTKALPGNTGKLKIALHNTKEISGIQFKLQDIPDLITPLQIRTTYRTANFSVSYEQDETGTLSVVLASEFGYHILQGTGDIVELYYMTKPNILVGDSADILLSDAIVSDKFEEPMLNEIFNGKFYCDVLKGDVVIDGDINVLDLVRVINIILERPPSPEYYELEAADYNSDSQINILDIVAIINSILGREPAGTLAKSQAQASFIKPEIKLDGNSEIQIPINFSCDQPIISAQLNIRYNHERLKVHSPVLLPRAENMTIAANDKNGILKILIYSLAGNSIANSDQPIFYLPVTVKNNIVDGNLVNLENVILLGENCRVFTLTDVEEINAPQNLIPDSYSLFQNYPNPFNLKTEISYQIPEASAVNLSIYNLLGEEIITLVDKQQDAGKYKVLWDGKDKNGTVLPTGVYLYRVQTDQYAKSRKLTILK